MREEETLAEELLSRDQGGWSEADTCLVDPKERRRTRLPCLVYGLEKYVKAEPRVPSEEPTGSMELRA